ncbi:hypothetical protein HHK36_015981 [Tetracentron sinense]|uniref:VTT domain-containing protein n=1 Tax=Tetracentron sinense TaxID=13715 RepID=A0A834Z751_TETSI|nr:hypothetical protein HHK36_015981 [Tetracentron sinense]
MGSLGRLSTFGVIVAILGIWGALSKQYGWTWDKDSALQVFRDLSVRLGFWAIPLYVLLHTVTLALCLPYAVFFEAGASLLFGFVPAVLSVFCAKILGASLSFCIGRQELHVLDHSGAIGACSVHPACFVKAMVGLGSLVQGNIEAQGTPSQSSPPSASYGQGEDNSLNLLPVQGTYHCSNPTTPTILTNAENGTGSRGSEVFIQDFICLNQPGVNLVLQPDEVRVSHSVLGSPVSQRDPLENRSSLKSVSRDHNLVSRVEAGTMRVEALSSGVSGSKSVPQWVLDHIADFGKFLGLSYEGREVEVLEYFCSLEPQAPVSQGGLNKRQSNELRRISSSLKFPRAKGSARGSDKKALESLAEPPPAPESLVELPSASESLMELPHAPEPLVELPTDLESLGKLPPVPESLVEIPSGLESLMEIPPVPESFVELPLPGVPVVPEFQEVFTEDVLDELVFRSSSSAMEWAQKSKYFHLLCRGVERDGWRFVLLARFSPIPSYVINYALAATKVGFLADFLLPTVIGCLPMILQNTSIGSLAGAAVASASGSQKSQVSSYLFPLLGIVSSILISLRIKKYSTEISVAEPSSARD